MISDYEIKELKEEYANYIIWITEKGRTLGTGNPDAAAAYYIADFIDYLERRNKEESKNANSLEEDDKP